MIAQKLEQKHTRRGVDGVEGDSPDNNVATKAMMSKIASLERDLERRQESYISRERAYKAQILDLERDALGVNKTKTVSMKPDSRMIKLKSMQDQIIQNVEQAQDRTYRILQEQEKDLVQSYRAKLFELQTELEKEKNKKVDGAGVWIEQSRKLELEVAWVKEVVDRLERLNQSLVMDNNRLKSQFKSQEEDRTFLITQLVNVKKENAHLKAEYLAANLVIETLQNQYNLGQDVRSSTGIFSNALAGKELSNLYVGVDIVANKSRNCRSTTTTNEKYKDTKERLRGLLIEEKINLQAVRANHATEMKSRSELETLLRQCVDDVREEISLLSPRLRHNSVARSYGPTGTAALPIPISCFQKCDGERTLELLLSRERVIHLLSANIFPTGQHSTLGNECAVIDGYDCHTTQNTVQSDMLLTIGVPDPDSKSNCALQSDKYREYDDVCISACELSADPVVTRAPNPNSAVGCALPESTGTGTDTGTGTGTGTRLPAI